MKKVALLMAAMLIISTITFAEDGSFTGPIGEATVKGSVTLKAGYDLDSKASGFDNSTDLTLQFPLADGSDTKGGDDDVYGEITIKDVKWYVTPGKFADLDDPDDVADAVDASKLDATIEAKLVFGDMFVKLGSPGLDMNNVELSDDYDIDANIAKAKDDAEKNWSDGMSAGFGNDMVTIEVKVASKGNYAGPDIDTDTDDRESMFDNDTDDNDDDDNTILNTPNQYVVGASLEIKPADGVTIPVSVFYDMFFSGENALLGIGSKPEIKIAPVTITLPIDVVAYMAADLDYGFEIMPTIKYELVEGGTNVEVAGALGVYSTDSVLGTTGITVVNPILEAKVKITEDESKGLAENVSGSLEVKLIDILNYKNTANQDLEWSVDADVAYNMDGIKPYLNTGYGSDTKLDRKKKSEEARKGE